MFERFTDRARRVVVLAQEEAKNLNHNYIGTEHVLLGLIREEEGVAAQALETLGISLDEVRDQVKDIIGMGQVEPTGHIPFKPRAKKVLELALREALQLGHNYIGTEHILLGIIREGEGVGAQVLVKLGAGLAVVRQVVIQLLLPGPVKELIALHETTEDQAPLEPADVRLMRDGLGEIRIVVLGAPSLQFQVAEVVVKYRDGSVLRTFKWLPPAPSEEAVVAVAAPTPAGDLAGGPPFAQPTEPLGSEKHADASAPSTVRNPRQRTHNGEAEATDKKD